MNIDYFKKDILNFWEENFHEQLVGIQQSKLEEINHILAINVIDSIERCVRSGYCLNDAYVEARKRFYISPDALLTGLCKSPLSLQVVLNEGGVF
tara:strand:- start:5870 stop:6154 length:285 start_codon:yes stop_codon:yes gene_type:complete